MNENQNSYKIFLHLCSIRMPNLSLNELKQITKIRRIINYKNMSKESLLSALDESKSAGSGNNFDNGRMKKIKKDFNKLRYGFSKSMRNNLHDIKNPKNLSKSKIKEIEQNLIESEDSIFKLISVMTMMTANNKE